MNEITAMWLVILSTLMFTIGMIIYNAKNLFRQDKSVLGVVFGLDNIRYTLMFLSFVSTNLFSSKIVKTSFSSVGRTISLSPFVTSH